MWSNWNSQNTAAGGTVTWRKRLGTLWRGLLKLSIHSSSTRQFCSWVRVQQKFTHTPTERPVQGQFLQLNL